MSRTSDVVPGTPLGERLLEAILAEKLAITTLGELVGASPGHIGRIIRGERWRETVDVELARKLAKRLKVNFAWLVIGEGPMRPGLEPPGVRREELEAFGVRLAQFAKQMAALGPTTDINEKLALLAEAQAKLAEQLDSLVSGDQRSRIRRKGSDDERRERRRGSGSD